MILNKCIFGLALGIGLSPLAIAAEDYTVLNPQEYRHVFSASRNKVKELLTELQPLRKLDHNEQVKYIVSKLAGLPYYYSGGTGEGDWQPKSTTYKPGAVHLDQHPVYRLDGLDCQTFVQTVMSLLYSNSLDDFDRNYLKISYGAAGNPNGEIVHYYNRNHFVDADLNPINHANGFLTDVTSKGFLANYAAITSATITRQKWFTSQHKFLSENINVLSDKDGKRMVNRFNTFYQKLPFKNFDKETVSISFIPKEVIVNKSWNGTFTPNSEVIDQIPTPAVAEIISDPQLWSTNGILIKDIIGTELNVSHFGVLYRQSFKQGQIVYQKTTCEINDAGQKICVVKPIKCEQSVCNELMYAHATDVYPDRYFWYQNKDGSYSCSAKRPPKGTHTTTCNRVEQMPLYSYFTDYQYGNYFNMNSPSILGVHVEKLT